jgi:class 3 adenylate cyclase
VSDYTEAELIDRAGVLPGDVIRLVALGILTPGDGPRGFSRGDVRRARIAMSLDHAGLPLTAIAEAIRRGDLSLDFVDQPSYDRFASFADDTFREVSARAGIPLELLVVVREAMGFAQADPDDRVRETELEVVPLLQAMLGEGVRVTVIERALRVYGDSLRRLAETEAGWWRSEILEPLFRSGKKAGEVGESTGAFAAAISDAGDRALLAIFHGQQANAWMKNIFEGFEGALARAGLHERLDRPAAICFLDLTGFTRLTEERGDDVAADLASRLATLVQRTSLRHDGKPVKWLGDGVMFHFREPLGGVLAALEMVEGAAADGLPPAHVGLHAGPILYQEGDYFGRTVNAAARIADYARPGEVVVSEEVVQASGGTEITFTEIGPVELKGLSGPLQLHVARRAKQ